MNSSDCEELGLADIAEDRHLLSSTPVVLIVVPIILSFIALFTVASNVTIIVALLRPRHMEKTITTSLVTSLAFTDAALGVFIMPLSIIEIAQNGRWGFSNELCSTRNTLDVILSTVSIFHVTNMAIERYLAVCKPWTHRTLSMKTTYFMIAVSWLLPAVIMGTLITLNARSEEIEDSFNCLQQNGQTRICFLVVSAPIQLIMATISFYGPLALIFLLYFLIFKTARASIKKQDQLAPHISMGSRTPSTLSCYNPGESFSEAKECSIRLTPTSFVTGRPDEHCNNGARTANKSNSTSKKWKNRSSNNITTNDHISRNNIDDQCPCSTVTKDFSSDSDSGNDLREEENYPRQNSRPYKIPKISEPQQGNKEETAKLKETSSVVRDRTSAGSTSKHFLEIPATQHFRVNRNSKRKDGSYSHRSRNLRTALAIGSLVVCFVVCWLPFSVIIVIQNRTAFSMPMSIAQLVTWLGYLNSAFNPILYCSHKAVKTAVWKLFLPLRKHCNPRKPSEIVTTSSFYD